ncbi:MAG: efflux transporter outer membrane subunit [Chlamydiota bacterium]
MRWPTYISGALVLLSTGCNFAPKYSRPDFNLPSTWRVEEKEGEDLANGTWWDRFNDPEMSRLIQLALHNNNDLQIAMWRVSEYLAQYQVAKSSLFPQISGNGGATKERFPVDADFLPPGTSPITPDYHLNLSLSYEFDFWGKVRNATTAAFASYLAQIENRRTVVLTLVGSVAQSYIYLKQLQLQLDAATAIMELRKESVQIARDRFEGGITSRIEVDQAISVYEETVATVKELEKKLPQQENLLSVLLGQTPGPIDKGVPLNKLFLPNEVPSCLPQDLLTRRPDILQAENNLIAANANIGVARAAFFPQLSLSALYGVDHLSLQGLFSKPSRTWLLGGGIVQEIFTGGLLVSQLKIAEVQKQELVFAYEQTILNALKEVDDSLIGFQKNKEIYAADAAEVVALQDYLALAWDRYYEGQTQYLTVLDAERQVLAAEMNMIAAQADQFLSLIDLYKAVGGGWVIEADAGLKKETGNHNLTP